MKIYLDMDDVVADWHGHAQEVIKMRWDNNGTTRIPQADWDQLKEDYRFYSKLPLKEGAHSLVQRCRTAVSNGEAESLAFLTALPHDYSAQWASYDKVFWAHKHFEGIPVFFGPFAHDKQRHCKPGDILIDDRHSNCHEWVAAGGKSHIYTTWENCEPWLENELANFKN